MSAEPPDNGDLPEVPEAPPGGFEVPERFCNGGPNGSGWCGAPATVVCTDRSRMQWFACDKHTEGEHTTPIAEWFRHVFQDDDDEPRAPECAGWVLVSGGVCCAALQRSGNPIALCVRCAAWGDRYGE